MRKASSFRCVRSRLHRCGDGISFRLFRLWTKSRRTASHNRLFTPFIFSPLLSCQRGGRRIFLNGFRGHAFRLVVAMRFLLAARDDAKNHTTLPLNKATARAGRSSQKGLPSSSTSSSLGRLRPLAPNHHRAANSGALTTNWLRSSLESYPIWMRAWSNS
jgi:hypothetical protein